MVHGWDVFDAGDGRGSLLPGPTGRWLIGSLFDVLRDPLGLFEAGLHRYGDTFGYRFGPQRFVLVHRPEDIRRVLVTNCDNYPKSVNYEGLKRLVGEGLLTSEGHTWRRRRRLAQPAFHPGRLETFAPSMVRCTEEMLDGWDAAPDGRRLDVHEAFMALTLRIVGHTLFSTELGGRADRMGRDVTRALVYANDIAESLLKPPSWLPTPAHVRFRRARGRLDRVVYRMIEARRSALARAETVPDDLLTTLLEARDEEGEARLDDVALRDELMTLVLAGHETTAVALGWTCFLLARHPEAEREVLEEVDRVLGDRPPTAEDLPQLEQLSRVVDESLRLYPPAWIIERQAIADDELDGYRIPAGAIVAVVPWTLHRHPARWQDPERFDPARFAPEAREKLERYVYLPFGGGPRVCIGGGFALMETKLALASVLRRYRFTLAPGPEPEPLPGITIRPREGIWMRAHRRAPRGTAPTPTPRNRAQPS